MSITFVELFQNGVWIKVPSIDTGGNRIVVTGKWLRFAAIEAEECMEGELTNPDECVQALKEHSSALRADVFTFAQKLTSSVPKYSFPSELESIAAMRLTSFSSWWDGLPQETRKNTRLAAKRGVIVREAVVDDELVRRIVEINNETPIRQGRQFTHFGEAPDKVKRDFQSFASRSDLLGAYLGDELIGLLKVIYCGPVAAVMKLQTKVAHYDKKPSNALMAKAIEKCVERGASCVTYGQYRYGNQSQTSLMFFKTRLGFEEMFVPRYYVPLTARGWIGTRLKLHRGAVGLLPPTLVQIGREMRARLNK
jgi:hypothetical protein